MGVEADAARNCNRMVIEVVVVAAAAAAVRVLLMMLYFGTELVMAAAAVVWSCCAPGMVAVEVENSKDSWSYSISWSLERENTRYLL